MVGGLRLGCEATAGIECMCGSAMYLITTGMPHSHTLRDLSSEVDTKRRLLSKNVMVLTGPRCWSYSWVILPVFTSHCFWQGREKKTKLMRK